MKKRNGLIYALAALLISCGHHDHNSSFSYKDKEQFYSMKAHFNKNRTRAVEHYMNEKIGRKNNLSFLNTETDADLTLDDGTKFHLEKSPGHIEIKLDKSQNSSRSFHAVKEMCEGMKDVVLQ